eukprot:IDg22597t1
MILRVHRPLYGIPEAGIHWFNTYHRYHTSVLGMISSSHDLCLLYTKHALSRDSRDKPAAITCLQTDDTLTLANTKFVHLEQRESTRFRSKPASALAEGVPLKFNGMMLHKHGDRLTVNAAVADRQLLTTIREKPVDRDAYVAQRARGSYIATVCRPDFTFGFTSAAQLRHAKRRCFHRRQLRQQLGLQLPTWFHLCADGQVRPRKYHTLRLCKVEACYKERTGRRTLLYGVGFDHSFVIRKATEEFLGRVVPLRMYTDSLSLFDSLTTLNTTSEKRLLIDLSMLRESYEKREIADVYWIPGDQNPADGLTKKSPCAALSKLIATNSVDLTPKAWIERKEPAWKKLS